MQGLLKKEPYTLDALPLNIESIFFPDNSYNIKLIILISRTVLIKSLLKKNQNFLKSTSPKPKLSKSFKIIVTIN